MPELDQWSGDAPLSQWITDLKAGDEKAARVIWERFFERACTLARRKLGDTPRRTRDEEDVAQSAMFALCDGARAGRFLQLETREDLWQLLAMLTSRKASNTRRANNRSQEVGESAIAMGLDDLPALLVDLEHSENSDEFIQRMSLSCEHLLGQLDEKLRKVAFWRLQGFSNAEIAGFCGRSEKSIERYLKMIRQKWNDRS